MFSTLRRYAPCLLFLGVSPALAACSSGGSAIAPVAAPAARATAIPSASAMPTASPSGAPVAASTLSPVAVASALANVQTEFAALSHQSVASDLSALAAQMVSSGAFKAAVADPGGITATLPDGSTALVFADRLEDVTPAGAAAAAIRVATGTHRDDLPLSAQNGHEIAFLINETDTKAFTPARQTAFAAAFTARGFTSANGYGVDDLDVTLDNVSALSGRGIDLLDIATHGSVAGLGPLYYYAWLSDTPVNAANSAKYAAAIANGSVQYGVYISLNTTRYVPVATYSFTPQFLASTLTFNTGSFVDNQSCYGYNAQIANDLKTTLTAAHVGRYLGWTQPVGGNDADGTDGFLFDRFLGEQMPATGLAAYAPQQAIPQQPFSFDDVYPVADSELRNSPFQQPGPGYSYTRSGPAGFNGFYNGTNTGTLPLEIAMPSINALAVSEKPLGSSLQISGAFPSAQGTVTITDGTGAHALPVTSWSTTSITTSIPNSGPGSGGDVAVVSSTGIGSNTVPLTKWSGTLNSVENDVFDLDAGISGSGSGTITAQYTVDFRADVHPFAPSPDASPFAQNLAFSNVESDSNATVTGYSGTFNSTSQNINNTMMPLQATFSLGNGAVMPVSLLPLTPPSFALGAVSGQPAPCNDGAQGPGGTGTTNVFCPGIGFKSFGVNQCVDNQSGIGCTSALDPAAAYGDGIGNDGLLTFTMNPSTYAIAVSSTQAAGNSHNFVSNVHTATGTVTGSIGAPLDPPKYATPVETQSLRRH